MHNLKEFEGYHGMCKICDHDCTLYAVKISAKMHLKVFVNAIFQMKIYSWIWENGQLDTFGYRFGFAVTMQFPKIQVHHFLT